jgi:murein DD-endopeptidase MepM/ murein hydrolase activator NlpD
MHAGVDFSVSTGTPVYATGDGVVIHAGVSSGYGYNVRIRHPKAKRITLYAHLSEIPDGIRRGVKVERGDVIGLSGNTGLSTAPHLHYEIRRLNNEAINPIYSFAPGVRPSEYHELVRIAESENAPLD